MMITRILKGLAPVAALAAGALVAGCDGVNIQIGDGEGVPLAELDTSGAAPTEIVLAAPDNVIVTHGAALDIDVTGDQAAVDAMRFHLEKDALAISRAKDSGKDLGRATVRVTMPSLKAMVLAGSGTIEADRMDENADVTVAGSGSVKVAKMDVSSLDVTIAGSGDFEATGSTDKLDLTVAGSGSSKMGGLKAGSADISVVGSGDAEFDSDGTVDASIVGAGSVTVNGNATCTVSSVGSGKLTCKGGTTKAKAEAPEPPAAPEAPEVPEAPEAPEG